MQSFYDVSLSYSCNVDFVDKFGNYNDDTIGFLKICNRINDFEVVDVQENLLGERKYLEELSLLIMDDISENIIGTIKCYVFLTQYNRCGFGIINVLFLNTPQNMVTFLLDNAQSSNLLTYNKVELNEYFKINHNILITSSPKSCVSFQDSSFDKESLIYILSHQSVYSGVLNSRIVSKEYTQYSNDNLSQYEGSEIYISDCSVVQRYVNNPAFINNEHFESNRIFYLALTIFMIEYILLRLSYLLELRNNVLDSISNKKFSYRSHIESNEFIMQMSLVWNANIFVYPITRSMFNLLTDRFVLNKQKEEFLELQSSFERLISLKAGFFYQKSNERLNVILLFLALTQILPVLKAFLPYVTNSILSQNEEAFLLLIFISIYILIVYFIYRKSEK